MPLFGTFRLESSATFRYQLNAPRLDWVHSPLRPEHRQLDGQAQFFTLSGISVPFRRLLFAYPGLWVQVRGMLAYVEAKDVFGVVLDVRLTRCPMSHRYGTCVNGRTSHCTPFDPEEPPRNASNLIEQRTSWRSLGQSG